MQIDDLKVRLGGVTAVMLSPFDNRIGALNSAHLLRLAQRCDASGVHAITALGNTAEPYQLSRSERLAALDAVATGAKNAAKIAGLAGSHAEALETMTIAETLGYDAVMLCEPLDPYATEAGIVDFWRDLMDRSPLPTIPYIRTPRLTTTGIAEIVRHPKTIGVKLAWRAPVAVPVVEAIGIDACTWVAGGAESQFLELRKSGVEGFTSGLANVDPTVPMRLWQAAQKNDEERLSELTPDIVRFEGWRTREASRWNVAVLKAALAYLGMDVGGVRAPCEPIDDEVLADLRGIIDRWVSKNELGPALV